MPRRGERSEASRGNKRFINARGYKRIEIENIEENRGLKTYNFKNYR